VNGRGHRQRNEALEGPLLPILHEIQAEFGYVPQEALPVIARELNLSRAEVHGVVTFYHDYRDHPAGRHVLKLCRAEACQSMGGDALAERVKRCSASISTRRRSMGRHAGAGLSVSGSVRLLAAAMLDGEVHGRLDARWVRDRCGGAPMSVRIFVPRDAAALALGAEKVAKAIAARFAARGSMRRSCATARAACIGWSRWSRSRLAENASAMGRSRRGTSPRCSMPG
jgi:formate dehydrogenase subunit gamma